MKSQHSFYISLFNEIQIENIKYLDLFINKQFELQDDQIQELDKLKGQTKQLLNFLIITKDIKARKLIDLNNYDVCKQIKQYYYENMEINRLHLDEFNKFLSLKLIGGLQSLSAELNQTQDLYRSYLQHKNSCYDKYNIPCCKVDYESRSQDLIHKIQIQQCKFSFLTDYLFYYFKWLFVKNHNYLIEREKLNDKNYIEFIELFDKIEIEKQDQHFIHTMNTTYSSMDVPDDLQANQKLMLRVSRAIYYYSSYDKAKQEAELFFVRINYPLLQQIWDLIDWKPIKKLSRMVLPRIQYNHKIYLNYLLDDVESLGTRYEYSFKRQKDDDLKIRVLCNQELIPVCSEQQLEPNQKIYEKIIFHIHGGGFIAMSSQSHECYTIQWAMQTDVPVFSVDYRLAPKYPFPFGLEDVYNSYKFLLQFVSYNQLYKNLKIKKIMVVGDSAGANLGSALVIKCIEEGVRLPDFLFFQYPVFNLQEKFTYSKFNSLDDILIHPFIQRFVLESYVQSEYKEELQKNALISPILVDDQILAQFPRTIMIVGNKDPLRDDSILMATKMNRLDVNIYLRIYEHVSHGFLNRNNYPSCPQYIKNIVDDCVSFIKQLFNQQ